ncbi:hypothetical protein [Hymenobacter sediminis]|uniref:hypothetical protein n=1 Tax=Hymenobacter sediminis TaxID=2218621 RepID=UPI00138FCBD8|nr:hypothetical protein [Hymenobacter sediminis]
MARVTTLLLLLVGMILVCGAVIILLRPEPAPAKATALSAVTHSWATIKLMFR